MCKYGNALYNTYNHVSFTKAFAMIDQNRDGVISVEDLEGIYGQLGESRDQCQ